MLSEPILVLNKSWRIISITTAKKALTLLYTGSALAICTDTYQLHDFDSWIRLQTQPGEPHIITIRFCIKIPEIILLSSYDGFPPQGVTFSRKNIYKRDNYTCQYCNSQPGTERLTVDHVIPRSRGGHSDWYNCVSACEECNKKKGNRLLHETHMKLLRSPYKPEGDLALFFPLTSMKMSWENFIRRKLCSKQG